MRVIYQYFIGKGFTCIKSCFYNFLCFFAPKTVFSGFGILVIKNFEVEKSIFFDFSKMSSKWILLMNMAWKRLLGALKASFWHFSACYGDMASFCEISKFSKNAIFAIFFGIFGVGRFGLKKAQKMSKKWTISKFTFFTTQRCFQIPRMMIYDHEIVF